MDCKKGDLSMKQQDERVIITAQYPVKKSMPLFEFLLLNCKKMSRNNIKHLLSNKQILIDGAVVSQFDFLLSKGDLVQISKNPVSKVKSKKQLKIPPIIYEDDEFLVINKPSGLLSISNEKEVQNTAYRIMMDYVCLKNPKNRIYVVHRIDKDTSGVLVFVKNEKLRNHLQIHWNDVVKTRQYIAIVEGKMDKKQGDIVSFLKKASTNLMYSSKNPQGGQKAITHYQVLKENNLYSMLSIQIDTGRKNQIRVHLSDLGHKIIGDQKYGPVSNPIQRLGLHASLLEFVHPFNHKTYTFKAKVPTIFNTLF